MGDPIDRDEVTDFLVARKAAIQRDIQFLRWADSWFSNDDLVRQRVQEETEYSEQEFRREQRDRRYPIVGVRSAQGGWEYGVLEGRAAASPSPLPGDAEKIEAGWPRRV